MTGSDLYGLLGRFREPEPLQAAVRRFRRHGYTHMDAFSPFPIPGLADELGTTDRVRWVVLAGGILGAAAAYGLALYSVTIDYPINVGGRPLHAWPAFLVLGFEGGILGAACGALFGMLAANGLPTYYHPVFNARHFSFAEGGGFYLLIESSDPQFDALAVSALLADCGAVAIDEVPP